METTKTKPNKKTTKKKLEKPLKLNMSFDEAIKKIINVKVPKKE
jgi:hypothetical protein